MAYNTKLQLRLFGPFSLRWADGSLVELRSAKQQALIALLATASDGIRTRVWIQKTLWGRAGPEHGRASLRQALGALRKAFGVRFDAIFDVTPRAIRIRHNAIEVIGEPRDGNVLEGLDIREVGYKEWAFQVQRRKDHAGGDANSRSAAQDVRLLPSVAMLPLLTLQEDDYGEKLGDAVAQEITRALSRSQLLSVISHLSCRDQSIRAITLNEIKEALNVEYLACGTLRKQSDRMQVDIDFVDARDGRILWTSQFTEAIAEFLRGGDDMIQEAARRIGRSILTASIELAATRPLPDVESHALLLSGISLMHRQSLRSFSKAREQLEEVVRRVPHHSIPFAWLGKWYTLSVHQGWSVDLAADRRKASDCTARALDLNPECPLSLTIDGFVKNNLLKRLDEAGARYDEALEIEPNNALAWLLKGTLMAFVDRGEEAVAFTQRARLLSPLGPYGYFFDSLSATACAAAGDWNGALELAQRSLEANRRHSSTLRVRTVALQILGRHEEARASAAELLRIEPTLTIDGYMAKHPAAEFRTGQEWARALQSAGIPKH